MITCLHNEPESKKKAEAKLSVSSLPPWVLEIYNAPAQKNPTLVPVRWLAPSMALVMPEFKEYLQIVDGFNALGEECLEKGRVVCREDTCCHDRLVNLQFIKFTQ